MGNISENSEKSRKIDEDTMPTADELFGPDPTPPSGGYSVAMDLADQECARLLVSTLNDPPPQEKSHQRRDDPKPEDVGPPIRAVWINTIETKDIEWFWYNRIPRGAMTIVEGEEGIGKSTMLCALAAVMTTGKGPEGFVVNDPGVVLWLSAEEDVARVTKKRLIDAGANLNLIAVIRDPFTFDDRGLMGLREQIAEFAPSMVVIDPIFAYLSGDSNRGNDARRLTNDLKQTAEMFNVAMLLVRHIGKARGMGDPRAAGLGSVEWRAAVRSVLLVGADPDDRDKRAVTQNKNNYGPHSPAIGYKIESDPTALSGARFYWTGESDLTPERLLASVTRDEDEKAGHREAEDFLREVLADGERPAKDIQAEAKQYGISESTLNRTKRRLGVKSRCEGGGFGSSKKIWYWSLPTEDGHDATEDGHILESEHLTVNHSDKNSYSNGLAEDGQKSICEHLTGGSEHLTVADEPEADGEEFEI